MAQDINIGVSIDSKGMGQLSKQTDAAVASLDSLNTSKNRYNKLEKGSAQLGANSTKNFAKMNSVVGDGLVPAYAALAANVFAVSAAFNVLRRSAQMEQLKAGIVEVGRASGQNLTMLSEDLKAISGNALSAAQSMEAVALGASSGFSSNQLEELTRVAKGASLALGRNLPDSIDRLVRGAAKLEPEILDELGIMVRLDQATSDYAQSIGKSVKELTQFEKRQAFTNAIIDQGVSKFGALADSMDSNVYDSLAAAFDDLSHAALSMINSVAPAIRFLSDNMLLLLGTTAALGSGVIGQMIPSLTEGGNAAAAMASEQSALAQQNIKNIKTFEGAPKVFQKYVKELEDGTLTEAKSAKMKASLTKSIDTHNRQMEGFKKSTKGGQKAIDAKTAKIVAATTALGAITAAEAAATVAAELNTVATYQNAAAQGNLQGMLVAGKAVWAGEMASTLAAAKAKGVFGATVTIVNGTLGTMLTLLKGVAIYILKLLPTIGLILITAGALYMAFKKLKDMSMDALDKSLEKVGERMDEFPNILDKTIERIIRAKTEWDAFGAGLTSAAGMTTQLRGSFTEIALANAKERAKRKQDLQVEKAIAEAAISKLTPDQTQTFDVKDRNQMIDEFGAAGTEQYTNKTTKVTDLEQAIADLEARENSAAAGAEELSRQQRGMIELVGAGLGHFKALASVTEDNANLQKLYSGTISELNTLFNDLKTASTDEDLAEIAKRMKELERETNNASEAFNNLVSAQDKLIAKLRENKKAFGFMSEYDDLLSPIKKALDGLGDFDIDPAKLKTLADLFEVDESQVKGTLKALQKNLETIRKQQLIITYNKEQEKATLEIHKTLGASTKSVLQDQLKTNDLEKINLERKIKAAQAVKDKQLEEKLNLDLLKLTTEEMKKQAELRAAEKANNTNMYGSSMANTLDAGAGILADTGSTDAFNDLDTSEKVQSLRAQFAPMMEDLAKLGPQGELMASISQSAFNMSEAFSTAFENMKEGGSGVLEGLKLVGASVQAISSIQQAQSKAAIAGIDEQIAAEQKRDGKSAQSVAKINKMEAQKEAVKKKAFEANKKAQMAQIAISVAAAIASNVQAASAAAAQSGLAAPAVFSGTLGLLNGITLALGAAQMAVVAGSTYSGGGGSPSAGSSGPTSLSIGERRESTDLSKSNSASGELSYFRGSQGTGGPENFTPAFTGYRASGGNTAFMVGEQGPEMFVPERPGTIVPADDTAAAMATPVTANINISAVDAAGVEEVLVRQRGNIIGMIREAANANGETFLESVSTSEV